MTTASIPGIQTGRSFDDRYPLLLAAVLFGYAMLGKGFAYVGVPPLFVGEISLVLGILVMLRSGCLVAALTQLPCLMLATLMAWVLMRTLPNIRADGLNAIRDSMIVFYGLFGLIVISLIVEKPDRLLQAINWFAAFTIISAISGPVFYFLEKFAGSFIPSLPGSDSPIINVRAGEVAVHLAGAAVFVLLGFRQVSAAWVSALVVGIALISAQSRGGMLAILGPVAFAAVAGGKGRVMIKVLFVVTIGLAIAYALDLELPIPGDERPLGARQMVDNFLSVFSSSDNAQLDGTKEWRINWWHYIEAYTFHGDYFWTGKGFGPNLAQVDGFVVGDGAVRAPHSAHMTILARSGVPGLVLWALTLSSVFFTLFKNMIVARGRGDLMWSNLFLFLACYLAAILIDASFDVALEGPMLGIWFWVLFGLGVGATMVYRGTVLYPTAFPVGVAAAVSGLVLTITVCVGLHGQPAAAAEGPAPASAAARMVLAISGTTVKNAAGSCVTLTGIHDAIIEDMVIGPCANHGIELIDSQRVTIRNLTIAETGETGIYIRGSSSVDVTGNTIANTIAGVVALSSTVIKVNCNTLGAVRGPLPSGQFVQFNDVHGPGNRISCNIGRNTLGFGRPEDAISVYRSSGTPDSPILISDNLIVGGGPSESGGGIMLGDDGGSDIVARSNVLVDPGQYGIAVASGQDIAIVDNLIFGRRQPFTNVGIYVWNQSQHPCGGISVAGNRVRWLSKTGNPNPWWDGGNCGGVQGLPTNDFQASISAAIANQKSTDCGCGLLVGRQ